MNTPSLARLRRTLVPVAILGLGFAGSAAAQAPPDTVPGQPNPECPNPDYSNRSVVAAAMGGSLLGLVVGGTAAYPFVAGGSEDVLGPFVLALLTGSVAGTAIGIRLASHKELATQDAVMGAVLGIGAGIATNWAIDKVTHGRGPSTAYLLGFTMSQGAFASAFALGQR